MNKCLKKIVITLLLILNNISIVYASSGSLKQDSIKTCPDGKTYGYHGKDNHWHEAEPTNTRSGWSAVDEPLAGDPCSQENTESQYDMKTTNSNNTSVLNSNNEVLTQPNDNSNIATNNIPVNKEKIELDSLNDKKMNNNEKKKIKSSNTNVSKLIIDGTLIYSNNNIYEYTTKNDNVNIDIKLEDPKSSYKINGNINDLSLNGVNEIIILVTAEDETKKEYLLNIKREKIESNVRIKKLKICNNSVVIGNDRKLNVEILNNNSKLKIEYELSNLNSKLIVLKNNKEVKNEEKLLVGNNKYKLKIIDEFDNSYIYELNIYRMNFWENILYVVIGLTFIGVFYGFITYVLYKIIKIITSR